MFSKIIKNGTIIDGTGAKAFRADVAIEKDKIVKVGDLKDSRAHEIIDASGKYVAPGFVDVQNHSDVYWTIFDNPSLDSLVAQGITTALLGNCGASLAPLLSRDALLSVQKWHNLEGVNFNWLTFDEYLDQLSKRNFGANIGSLVGYSTLRRGLVKDNIRELTADEIKSLAKVMDESMDAGAFGLSSGLSYAHEAIISENELVELTRIVRKYEGLFSIHLRSEGAEITESVSEALEFINKSDVNLKISHFKVRGKTNWHLLPHAMNLIENAYQRRGNIHFDLYPYDFMWQVLYTYLPRWSYEGGRVAMLSHLKDETQRRKIISFLNSRDVNYAQMYIASTSIDLNVVGKSIGEIASRHNLSSEEALLSIIENGGSEIMVFDRNLDQGQVEQLLAHPLSIVASDGAGFSAKIRNQLVHPRCFGSMPKFLSIALQKKILSLEEAVKKITSVPAAKMNLKKRGAIANGNYADIVVFGDNISSEADYANPHQLPTGIEHVLVNGELALAHGVLLPEQKHGRVLRRK